MNILIIKIYYTLTAILLTIFGTIILFWGNAPIGLAILSFAIAASSYYLAVQSSKQMSALTNLNFVEKHAMLQHYIKEFKDNNFDNIKRCKLDIEALLEIKDWIIPEKKKRLINDVIELINGAITNEFYQYYFDFKSVNPTLVEILDLTLRFNIKTNDLNKLKKRVMKLSPKK